MLSMILKCVPHAQQDYFCSGVITALGIVVSCLNSLTSEANLGDLASVRTESEKKSGVISLLSEQSRNNPWLGAKDFNNSISFCLLNDTTIYHDIVSKSVKMFFKNCCLAYTEILHKVPSYFNKPSNIEKKVLNV